MHGVMISRNLVGSDPSCARQHAYLQQCLCGQHGSSLDGGIRAAALPEGMVAVAYLLACYIKAWDKPGQALPVGYLAWLPRLVLSASNTSDGMKGGCRQFLWAGVECTRV
jgi:hypothetical protein